MNVDVALADPVGLFLFWIAIPVTFVSIAWWITGRGRDSSLIVAWAAATLLLAAVTTWLAPRQGPVGAAADWRARGGAFLQTALVLGSGLAAVALLARRQRTRGVRVLTGGLVVRAVAAYVGVSLLLFIAIVAVSIARDVAAVPIGRRGLANAVAPPTRPPSPAVHRSLTVPHATSHAPSSSRAATAHARR